MLPRIYVIALFALPFIPSLDRADAQPLWSKQRPRETGYWTGIGVARLLTDVGETRARARNEALSESAAQIETSLQAEIRVVQGEGASGLEQEYRAEIRTEVAAQLEQVEIVDAWDDGAVLTTRRIEGTLRAVPSLADELGTALAQSIAAGYKDIRKVAVLYFQNHADDKYDSFVQGIADMMMTSLGQSQKLKLIERVQIDKAVENFNLELSGAIDTETAVEVGAWLGADAVVLGSFTKFGELYRIDARLIDAETGELLLAQNVPGAEGEVIALVDRLGSQLIERFDDGQDATSNGVGTLQIRFHFTKSEMGERPVYHHICKLYIDGQYQGMSPVVEKLGEDATLFRKNLKAGTRKVQVIHGYVKDGHWDGEMPEQPRPFRVEIEPDGTTSLRYGFEVGWFEDKYVYQPSR